MDKKEKKKIPKYTGGEEVYFPDFKKKIVKNGDLVEEMPLEEAEARSDFEIVTKRGEL